MSSQRILSPSDTGVFRDPMGNITGSVDYHPQLSPVVTFQKATVQQIQDALRGEEYRGDNATLALAKQGLYEAENQNTIFHPRNRNWIGHSFSIDGKGKEGSYTLSREVHDSMLEVFGEKPELIYVN